jgi:hypothetical protein
VLTFRSFQNNLRENVNSKKENETKKQDRFHPKVNCDIKLQIEDENISQERWERKTLENNS